MAISGFIFKASVNNFGNHAGIFCHLNKISQATWTYPAFCGKLLPTLKSGQAELGLSTRVSA